MRTRPSRIACVFVIGLMISSAQNEQAKHPGEKYFPPHIFRVGHSDGSFAADWFARDLQALQEMPLKDGAPDGVTIYRFTFLPTFDHPVSVRVTVHANGSGSVIGRTTTGKGGYDPGKMSVEQPFELSTPEVRKILDLMPKPEFWAEPTEVQRGGADGAQWILEGVMGKKYHVVDRWEGGSLRPLGEYLLRMFGPGIGHTTEL